jgi:phospholipid N-methyltransferase
MAREIDGASNVIEFGGGQGAVTLQILKRLPENGRLTSFEINPSFCEDLQSINDPRLKVVNDDAANCERHIESVDYIVSSLPLRIFEKSHRKRILEISSKSKKYVQLQYSPFLRKRLESYFKNVRTKFVLRNIPPAIIYICETSTKSIL